MKKLFALFICTALMLTAAVPVMAAGWDADPVPEPIYENIQVEFNGLDPESSVSVLDEPYVTALKEFYPVVKGTEIKFYIKVTVPAEDKLPQNVRNLMSDVIGKGLYLNVITTNAEITYMKFKYIDNATGMIIGEGYMGNRMAQKVQRNSAIGITAVSSAAPVSMKPPAAPSPAQSPQR